MENQNRELFESVPVKKALLKMSVPTVISQLIALVYNVVDTFFIGRTGNAYMVAAVSLSFPIFMFTIAISNLFGTGGGSLMARLSGRHEDKYAKSTCAYSFFCSLLTACLYSAIVFIFLTPVLNLLGASEKTMPYAKQYIWLVVIIGNIPTVVSSTMAHLLRNAGFSKQASLGLSMGGILNIILDPLLMFVLLPEGYEVMGAAAATMLSNTIACIFLFCKIHSLSCKTVLSTSLKDARAIRKQDKRQIYSVGLPSSSLNALYDITILILNYLMAKHGDLQLAAIGLVLKIERLPNAINIGLCQGMLPIIAYNYSSGNSTRMKETQRITRKWILYVCIITTAMYELAARPICGFFLNTSTSNSELALETIAYAVIFLRIRSFQSFPQSMNFHPSFTLQAMGKGKETFIHSLCRQCVFSIPAMFILNIFFAEKGLVAAILLGETLGAILAHILLFRVQKKEAVAY